MSNVTIDIARTRATKRRALGASLLAFVLGWAGCSSPQEHFATDEVTPGTTAEALATTLNPVADTYVRDGSFAGTNFGTSTTLEVKKSTVGFNREAYLRFSLSSFSGTVQNAKLRVFGKISQAGSVPIVARMLQDFAFDESFTTFNIKPETLPIELGRVSVTSTIGAWHEFDVTSLVRQKKRAGDASIEFSLVNQVTSTPSVTFNSREATTSKPELVIDTATALFVVGNTTLNSGDAALSARLSQLGFSLTTKTGASATTADATGKSLVVVSSTVTSGDVNTKFRDVAVPVVVCENAIFDDMKMTGTVANTDFGTTANLTNVAISDNLHALAGGREGSVAVSGSNPLTWGKPGASGLKIATVPGDTAKTTVFAYDKGIAMVGMNAPERRVGLFLGDTTAASFNRSGWAIFDAAINWASSSKPFITKKVGVFIYDPILESKPGQPRLSAFLGWPNPHDLARQAVTQFSQTSGDYVRYQITTDVDVDEWPLLEDNTRYTDQGYLDDYATQTFNRGWAKYPEMIAARQWDQGINNGTYDEVWVGGPRGIGFFESKMVGQGALTVNSGPVVPPQTVANRRYMIEFLDWTVPLAFFQHGYVHRVEWLMRYVYFEKWGQDALNYPFPSNWNTSPYEPACLFGASGCPTVRRHLWDKFTLVDGVAQNLRAHGDPTAVAGVGTAHYVPGAQLNPGDNYNYGAVPAVTSNADDWMFNFPNLTGESRSLSVSEWQANWCWGDYQCGFMLWFNNHLPRVPGRSSAADRNVLLNWWEYAVNFEDYAETKP